MHPVIFIVFLPLLAAIIAGLGGRWIGQTPSKVVTTGSLFIGAALTILTWRSWTSIRTRVRASESATPMWRTLGIRSDQGDLPSSQAVYVCPICSANVLSRSAVACW